MRYFLLAIGIIALTWSSCTFTRKVRTGMQAYEVKQYSVATQLFSTEYEASSVKEDKAIIAYFAGESYSKMHDPVSAAVWYFYAHQNGYGPEALEHYAVELKKQEKYQEAIVVYEDLLKSAPGNASYRSNITLCRQAMEWKKNTNPAWEILPVSFNTTAADYSPMPIGPGLVLFTSDRASQDQSDTYLWTGRSFSDIYLVNTRSEEVFIYDSGINSKDNEGTAILSPDRNMLVFTRCYVDQEYDAWCKLMYSFARDEEWTPPMAFPFVKEKVNYGHPAFAANGTTLFFSSDAIEGNGGHDLYFTQMDGTGAWSEPVNLGGFINSSGNEQYPTVYNDTLFFSSDYLPGLGGLDIFKTYLDAKDQWVPPINLGSPINSGGDDFGFVVDTFATLQQDVLMKGFFTSSRGGVAKSDDIYSFSLSGKLPDDVVVANPNVDSVEEIKINYQLFLSLKVMEPQFEVKDDPNSKRIGKRALPNGPIIVSDGETDQRFVTDELGQFLIALEWDKEFTFTARYRDHLAVTYTLNTSELEKNPEKPITTINQILELDPIFKNKEIVIDNIFYDYDQWDIRDDAKPSLNKLSTILKTNPSIRIQLSSYTDCRGTDEYNIDLSQKRAQSAIDYLMSLGIPARRLEARGYGETNLAVQCVCEDCTEAQHQANRLTTFKIID